jgi:hypothetical protein
LRRDEISGPPRSRERRVISRQCHFRAGAFWLFAEECGFPVIYFVLNIFFLARGNWSQARTWQPSG